LAPFFPILVGLFLLFAAFLKLRGFLAVPFGDRMLTVLAIEIELFLACWLLSGLWPRASRIAAGGCFAVFFAVASFKAVSGAETCGCLGPDLSPKPGVMAAMDAGILLLLGLGGRSVSRPGGRWRKTFVLMWLPLALTAGWLMATARAKTVNEDGIIGTSGPVVVLEPERWVGKRFPLLDHIDIGGEVAQGRWLVIFHRQECEVCQRVVPEYLRQAEELRAREIKLALVEVPPYGESLRGKGALQGRLAADRDWFVQTPALVWVTDGRVERAETVQHASRGARILGLTWNLGP